MRKILLSAMLLISSTSIFAQETTQLVLHMKDKTETVISLSELDSITFRTPADDGKLSLTCTIDELTPSHATYTIHANQSNDAYYQFLMSESTYNAMIEQYGNLQNHDQAWWTELSKYYENATWEDVMRMQMVYGTKTFQSEEIIRSLEPQTNYVIYYYGIDDNGNMTTEIGTKKFTTPKPGESANTFTISDIEVSYGSVSFNVTPTNNDRYFASAQNVKMVNDRLAAGKTMREIAQEVINVQATYNPDFEDMIYTGEQRIECGCSLEDTDYIIMVCGYDGGVTTDVTTANFHTLK